MLPAALLPVTLLLVAQAAPPPVYRYDPAEVRTGWVYHYKKTNLSGRDRTSGSVSVYRPDPFRLEAMEYDKSASWGELLEIEMDWASFNITGYRTSDLRPGRSPEVHIDVRIEPSGLFAGELDGAGLRGKINVQPWHVYGFGFASLGNVMPHLADPSASFRFFVGNPMEITGPVDVTYLGRDAHSRIVCHKYAIDGAGLGGRGGHLWTDEDHGHIVALEIQLPDSPRYTSQKLELVAVEPISKSKWECLKSARGKEKDCRRIR